MKIYINNRLYNNVVCKYCNKEFLKRIDKIKEHPSHFCSKKCYRSFSRKELQYPPPLCACGCGKPVRESKVSKRWNKFINGHAANCFSDEARRKMSVSGKKSKGRKLSKEAKNKISKSKIGFKHTQKTKDKIGKAAKIHRLGSKLSEETKRKLSILNSGKNSNFWRGGIAAEPYCDVWLDKEFKESIKKRDGYKCLNPDCWKTTDRLCIMHIDNNKKNCHPSNLITGCFSCNARAQRDKDW